MRGTSEEVCLRADHRPANACSEQCLGRSLLRRTAGISAPEQRVAAQAEARFDPVTTDPLTRRPEAWPPPQLWRAPQVYEYVEDIMAALAEARRVLPANGRLLVQDTDWDRIVWHSRATGSGCSACSPPGTSTLADPYLPRRLPGLLRAAGLEPTTCTIIPILNVGADRDTFSAGMSRLVTRLRRRPRQGQQSRGHRLGPGPRQPRRRLLLQPHPLPVRSSQVARTS
jgi:hypothetical protein